MCADLPIVFLKRREVSVTRSATPPSIAPIDCLVLSQDKVIRAMLATCAESVGLTVHQGGSAQFAVEQVQNRKQTYRMALVAPQVEGADAARVAQALAGSGRCARVFGYGITPHADGVAFEAKSFPVDFVELFLELKGRGAAVEAAEPVSPPAPAIGPFGGSVATPAAAPTPLWPEEPLHFKAA